jgi:hypothetical protein
MLLPDSSFGVVTVLLTINIKDEEISMWYALAIFPQSRKGKFICLKVRMKL